MLKIEDFYKSVIILKINIFLSQNDKICVRFIMLLNKWGALNEC